ncbi:MAG: hypothetical protein K2G26_03885, partial [Clostridia bacterium]|nr:hypothetical protein [Clostridia bacterium]
MKKILISACAIAMCAGVSAMSVGCNNDNNTNGVTLVEVSSDDVGRISGVSYYVVPEPAATAKVKALTAAGTEYLNVA